MKKLFLTTCTLLAISLSAWSQVHFDVKVGVSPGSSPLTPGVIINRDKPLDEFVFNMTNTKPQFYGGVKVNVKLGSPFFLESGLSFTQKKSQYQLDYTIPSRDGNSRMVYMNETENILQLPVDFGVSLGSVDITSGLTLSKSLSESNELTHIEGFNAAGKSLKMGWQAGIRYGFKRAFVGVEYQASLSRVGNGLSVNGHSLEIMNVPGKMVFSVQYRF